MESLKEIRQRLRDLRARTGNAVVELGGVEPAEGEPTEGALYHIDRAVEGISGHIEAGYNSPADLGSEPEPTPAPAPEPAPVPEGMPAPGPDATVHWDTHPQLQGATSRADVEAMFQAPTPHPDGGWGLATDIDGSGTQAIRLTWPQAMDRDVSRLLIVDDFPRGVSECWLQWAEYGGRTETGGGIGEIGAFDVTNPADPGASRKILRAFTNPWSGDQPYQSFNFHGSDPLSTTLSAGDYTTHVRPPIVEGTGYAGRVTTYSMYLRHASSEGASDGAASWWIDATMLDSVEGIDLGGRSLNRWQFPMIIRSPVQDQTSYVLRARMWTPA